MITSRPRSKKAFTLVEMLVVTVILALLLLMVNQLFSSASKGMTGSTKHIDADTEARLIFNRMAEDFDGILDRNDADIIFYKAAGNDALFFYSQAPAYFDTTKVTSPNMNQVSLLGYRIQKETINGLNYQQLERLGLGLTWDTNGGSSSVVNLTWTPAGFDAGSLLPGLPAIGAAPYQAVTSSLPGATFTAPYQVIGDAVFRLEIGFLLKDGTYSQNPVRSTPGSNLAAAANPTNASDSTQGFVAGSRWYNTGTGEAFICTNNSAGAAVWEGAGAQDITAIIVTIAVLDTNTQKLLADPSKSLAAVAGNLPDFPPAPTQANVQNFQQSWQNAISANAAGLPNAVWPQIHVYQRYFYLNQYRSQ